MLFDNFRTSVRCLVGSYSLLFSLTLSAADVIWDGSAGSAWRDTANWNTNAKPTATDNAVFNSSTSTAAISIKWTGNNDSESIGSITLSGGANRVIDTSGSNNGGPLLLSGVSGTLLSNTSASNSLTFAADRLSLTLENSGTINVTNSGASILVQAPLQDSTSTSTTTGFTKTGAGLLQLNGINTYAGATAVSAGSVELTSTASSNST